MIYILQVFLTLFLYSQLFAFPIRGETLELKDVYLPEGENVRVVPWIEGLNIPWSLIFLDDKTALVSERGGEIKLIKDGNLQRKAYLKLDVNHTGEGGLLGLARHPDFPDKPYVYAMFTYKKGKGVFNKVVRITHKGDHGVLDKTIIDFIPGGRFHNGGRIAFGPDKKIYITTGEIFESSLAQDLKSLGGKILRLNDDGSIPEDNPFRNSPIYSYGHRNPQGLSWHPETKDLFSSEHGPSGEFLIFGYDEINVIKRGGNYGWAKAVGMVNRREYIDPLIVWKEATPPSGIAFYNGNLLTHLKSDLFVATLRSECLVRINLLYDKGEYVISKIERWFHDGRRSIYGRIRDVIIGPDGAIYFLTNNRDGRGSPKKGDDKIYKIIPK
ncbi:MAG: PQQ-dependent sugar dehydrogenase [Proteobacteria bacterium]|nr:PQQ-dependent sugar dehydrogenase [Pseudomonadota bacterium]